MANITSAVHLKDPDSLELAISLGLRKGRTRDLFTHLLAHSPATAKELERVTRKPYAARLMVQANNGTLANSPFKFTTERVKGVWLWFISHEQIGEGAVA